MILKSAQYCRVSTEEQAIEGYSIDAQKEKLQQFCNFQSAGEGRDSFEIFKFYVDEGYSGRNANRPEYKKMIEEIDQWDALVVLKMDRIHRNSRNFMNMMDFLNKKEKQFVSATEDLDTSNAMGRFVMSMIQNIAQLESEQIGERTYMGMKEKAETMQNSPGRNKTMGFNQPFGYRIINNSLEEDSEEIEIVKEIFSSQLDGESIEGIGEDLNRSKKKTRKGNNWTQNSVSFILHNPVYAGYVRWDDILYRHYAKIAVTPEDFDALQVTLQKKIRNYPQTPSLISENNISELDTVSS